MNKDIIEQFKEVGKIKNNQIFISTAQLNAILGTKVISLGNYGIFITP